VPLDRLGDYQIVRELGRGGMGIVYEAVQHSLGRRVALKVLLAPTLFDPHLATRFRREAQAVARLHHTNIVQVYGAGEHGGLNYYVMQFIQGPGVDRVLAELKAIRGSLKTPVKGTIKREPTLEAAMQALLQGHSPSDLLAAERAGQPVSGNLADMPTQAYRLTGISSPTPVPGQAESRTPTASGPLYWRSVARIGRQVAEALAHAHAQGILHRDIKPSNLLLDDRGTVWVADFGLAKGTDDQDSLTLSGGVVGTLRYLAPERFQGRSDARGDIYSLGLTLYELLTLIPAFPCSDRSQLMHEVMNTEPPRPRQLDPAVPRDLETIVLTAIARDPDRRYRTARALAEDLQRFLEDRPIRARRASAAERTWRWCRRNPGIASLLVTVLVLLATVAVGSTVAAFRIAGLRDDEERQRRRAEENARQSHQGLVQLQITRGLQLMDGGDLFSALAWFTRALQLDAGQPAEEMHRIRLTAVLRQCPHLAQMWFHAGPTYSAEFSPDGRRVVTTGEDGIAQIWDLASGEAVTPPLRHEKMVCYAQFSPDGRRVVTASRDHSARVWDAATGEPITEPMKHEQTVWVASFSPDSRFVVTASADGTAKVWNAATGQAVTPPLRHEQGLVQAAFSPDGRWVVTASDDKSARVWDAVTGRRILPILWHETMPDWAAFSPDGHRLLTIAGHMLYLWDTSTGQPLYEPRKLSGEARRAAFTPDGRRVIVGAGDTVQIWDVATGQLAATTMQHATGIWYLAVSPDGRRVATVGGDAARLWDANTGEPLSPLLKHNGLANFAAFSPDGRFLATTGGETANVWDTRIVPPVVMTLKECRDLHYPVLSADGRYLATHTFNDGRLLIWDLASGATLPAPQSDGGAFTYAGFSGDGRWLTTTQDDQMARIWDLATRKLLFTLPRHDAPVRTVAVSPDYRLALTACEDQKARVWELATGLPQGAVLEHPELVTRAAFSPEGDRVLTVCGNWTAQVWDWRSGRRIGSALKHGGPLLSAAFSPDSRRVVTTSHDRTARIWDAATGEPLVAPLVHGAEVYSAAFSPDGRYVATGASNGTARVWEAATGLPLTLPLKHQAEVRAVQFSPDGLLVITVSKDGKVRRWDLGLTADRRPVEDLLHLAQLLDSHLLDSAGGFVPIDPATLRELWQQMHARYPD
jgi:WD40 repeat protein/serine/threonine protein kinase